MSEPRGVSDICSDCGMVGILGTDLLRCGRSRGDEWLVIQLCRPCLARVNPHIRADTLAAGHEDDPQ